MKRKTKRRAVVVVAPNCFGKDAGVIIPFEPDRKLILGLQPWPCPGCGVEHQPPLTTYISPRDGIERCEACSDGGGEP
jgi:hypothetical protein